MYKFVFQLINTLIYMIKISINSQTNRLLPNQLITKNKYSIELTTKYLYQSNTI